MELVVSSFTIFQRVMQEHQRNGIIVGAARIHFYIQGFWRKLSAAPIR